jgi:TPR repeat protein
MIATMEKTHQVVEVRITSSISETLNRVKQQNPGRKIEYAVIQAHGNPFGMELNPNKSYWWAGSNDFDAVEKDGRIFLWSCMTAAGGPFSLAKRIQQATGRAVFAPTENVGGCEIFTDETGKYIPHFEGLHGDISRSFLPKNAPETGVHEKSFNLESYQQRSKILGPEAVSAEEEHYLAALHPEARAFEEEYLKRAAAQNHPRAFYELARLYDDGQEPAVAVENYIRSAELGNEQAICRLAEIAVEENLEKAETLRPWLGGLLHEKALKGSTSAMAYLAFFVAKGWYTHNECTEERIIAGLRRATEVGDRAAHYVSGLLHFDGDLLPQSHKKAASYFEEIIREGRYPLAAYWLGYMYERGLGVKLSLETACEHYIQAINVISNNPYLKNSIERRFSLAASELLITKGRSAKKSQKAKFDKWGSWIKKELLSAETLYKLAAYFQANNPDACLSYVKAAAEAGHSGAQYDLAVYYQSQNKNTLANQWLREAAKNGNATAYSHLGNIYFDAAKKPNQKIDDILKSLRQALQAYTDAMLAGLKSAAKDVEAVRKYMFALLNLQQA